MKNRIMFIVVTLSFVTLACGRLVAVSPVTGASPVVVTVGSVTDVVTVAPSAALDLITDEPGQDYRVCNCEFLNIRDGVGGVVVGSLGKGDMVHVYEVSAGWGRIGIGQQKWVNLVYLCQVNNDQNLFIK